MEYTEDQIFEIKKQAMEDTIKRVFKVLASQANDLLKINRPEGMIVCATAINIIDYMVYKPLLTSDLKDYTDLHRDEAYNKVRIEFINMALKNGRETTESQGIKDIQFYANGGEFND